MQSLYITLYNIEYISLLCYTQNPRSNTTCNFYFSIDGWTKITQEKDGIVRVLIIDPIKY